MKPLFAIALVLFCANGLSAQTDTFVVEKVADISTCDYPPEFPGGEAGLSNYLRKNTSYPQFELDSNIEGKVVVKFIINQDGSISDVELLRGVSPGLNAEALRVVRSLPSFKPCRKGVNRLRVYYTLPFIFKLQ